MLLAAIDRAWRWLGTAFCFFVFGLGGALVPIIVVPVLTVLPGNTEQREKRAQRVIHVAFRLFIGLMKNLGVLRYQISGLEKLEGAKLILANHPSLIDVVFLIAMLPNANCVVKGKLISNPFTRGPIKAAGYIINDEAGDVIAAAAEAFAKGHALIIFPEGTRTQPAQPVQLKRGAANVAVRTNADITPVLIECNPTTLTKSDHWYRVPARRVEIRIQVKDLIKVKPYQDNINPSKGARTFGEDNQRDML